MALAPDRGGEMVRSAYKGVGMLRISLVEVKVWPVLVVTLTEVPESVMEVTGVEKWIVFGLRRAARPMERVCVPVCRQSSIKISWNGLTTFPEPEILSTMLLI